MTGIPWPVLAAGAILLLGALAYWSLVLAEGAYLGPRVVCKLYDWTASRYDSIKSFDPFYEQRFVGEPLAIALTGRGRPLVLDVAGGTGRLPRALFPTVSGFSGVVVELDRASAMLTEGRRALAGQERRVTYVQADALRLPFPDSTFDAVVSLEALEFLPDLREALAEMVRVLRPEGFLMVTNRKGWARYYMPGRVRPLSEVLGLLRELGLPKAESSVWQVNYDLVCAVKGSQPEPEARAVKLPRRA